MPFTGINCYCEGRLTADAQLKTKDDGTAYVMFTLAVDRGVKTKDGTYPTDFVSVFSRKLPDRVMECLKKGAATGVTGTTQTPTIRTGSDGKQYTNLTINATQVYPTWTKKDNAGAAPSASAAAPAPSPAPAAPAAVPPQYEAAGDYTGGFSDIETPDDLPFL